MVNLILAEGIKIFVAGHLRIRYRRRREALQAVVIKWKRQKHIGFRQKRNIGGYSALAAYGAMSSESQ